MYLSQTGGCVFTVLNKRQERFCASTEFELQWEWDKKHACNTNRRLELVMMLVSCSGEVGGGMVVW